MKRLMLSLASMKNMDLNALVRDCEGSWLPRIALCGLLFFSASGYAADQFDAEVRITPKNDSQIKEYRINGALYMIEVTPAKGPPYYLVDVDGDGVMETRRDNVESDILIPRWTLLRWK